MKINLFKVLLYDFLIIIVVNPVLYFLLVLVFRDSMNVMSRGDEFMWMTLAEMFGILFFALLFTIAFVLPLYYIQRHFVETLTPPELFRRFMPLVSLIAGLFGFFILLIGNQHDGIAAEAWLNFWLIFGIAYTGIISFVYLVKNDELKRK